MPKPNPRSTEHIIRPRDLPAETGLSRSTIRRLELNGDFPRKIRLSAGAVGYKTEDVKEWIATRHELGV